MSFGESSPGGRSPRVGGRHGGLLTTAPSRHALARTPYASTPGRTCGIPSGLTMPRRSYSVEVDAECEAVFDFVHDYDRRLSWDTMLSEARLLDGATTA